MQYAKKKIITARAILESLEGGVLKVELMEARIGSIQIEGNKFTARVSPKSTAKADDVIEAVLDLSYCHLFDAETERTLVN